MQTNENDAHWTATVYIWWGLLWRLGIFNLFFAFLYIVNKTLAPQFYSILEQAQKDYEHYFLILPMAGNVLFAFLAVRGTYIDRFPTVRLEAQNKHNKRTIYGPDGKLPIHLAMQVWWAFIWRTMLIPAGVMAGHLVAGIIQHPRVLNYSFLINPVLLQLSAYSLLVFSFWATHESIRDHYFSFRFVTSPKRIYD